jgi:hypothetical protein
MSLELIVVVAVVAVVGLVGLAIAFRAASARRASRAEAARPPGPLEGAADVIDRSIGMYAVRKLTGRPTAPPEDLAPSTKNLTADEVAYRIGVPDAPGPPPAEVPPPATAVAAATAAAARATTAGRAAPATAAATDPPVARRERLVRDAGFGLVATADSETNTEADPGGAPCDHRRLVELRSVNWRGHLVQRVQVDRRNVLRLEL